MGSARLSWRIGRQRRRRCERQPPPRLHRVPFARQGTGWETAYACLFLISHESSYVNGHALLLDGGQSIGVVRRAP